MLVLLCNVRIASAQGNSTDYPPGWNAEAVTPPMGWRSWNAFGNNIDDATFRTAVDAITAKIWTVAGHEDKISLADAGYDRVGIDEGWENCSGTDPDHGLRQHDSAGFPMINTDRFPDFKALVDYGHAAGIKMGWYLNGCACGEREERLLNYQGDVQRLHEFGFDAIKLDGCGAATNMTYYAELMAATGRTYEIENCHWGSCGADAWFHNPDGSSCPTESWCPFNHFRTSGDVSSALTSWFENLQTTIKFQDVNRPLSQPSCWSYPDMMEVGRIQGGTLEWSRAHFGAWCIVSAPLVLGLDLGDQATLASIVPFITNIEAIAINQAWAGHPGRLATQITTNTSALPIQVWVKPQPQGKLAVYVVNPTPSAYHVPDPLSCYTYLAGADKTTNNVCNGEYKIDGPGITSPTSCATLCLDDANCTAFVWALPSTTDATQCRLSHTCVTPTSHLDNYDGYVRTPAVAGCGVQPPAKPAVVLIDFYVLGLDPSVTSATVRDVWARKAVADATGGQLNVTVAPMDSAFVVLTPR